MLQLVMHLEKNCIFCKNSHITQKNIHSRTYFHCIKSKSGGCGGFFLHSDCFSTTSEQKQRYLLHSNDLGFHGEHNGYRTYLERYVETVLCYERTKKEEKSIYSLFDYGSGPTPALVQLLKEYNCKFVFKNDVKIKHWDPFFYPDGDFFENGADIVFCLEVIEHFENPLEGFRGLAKSCAQGGLIAIQTQLAPNTFEDFEKWWYKEDSTHVSFYTLNSIEECAKQVGLHFEDAKNGVFFLRKN